MKDTSTHVASEEHHSSKMFIGAFANFIVGNCLHKTAECITQESFRTWMERVNNIDGNFSTRKP